MSAVIHAEEVMKGTETGRQHGNEAREKDLVGKLAPVTMEEVVGSIVSTETLVSGSIDHAMRRHPVQHLVLPRVRGQQMIRRPGSTLRLRTATARSTATSRMGRHREKRYQSAHLLVQTHAHEKAGKAEAKVEKVVRVLRKQRRLLALQIGQSRSSSESRLRQRLYQLHRLQRLHGPLLHLR